MSHTCAVLNTTLLDAPLPPSESSRRLLASFECSTCSRAIRLYTQEGVYWAEMMVNYEIPQCCIAAVSGHWQEVGVGILYWGEGMKGKTVISLEVDGSQAVSLLATFDLYLKGIRGYVKEHPLPWVQYMALAVLLDPLSKVYYALVKKRGGDES